MKQKVVLICVDGMRPDGFLQCGNPTVKTLMERGSWTLNARTVMPSCTLPCHMSMFHGVSPMRHGITTNLYTPPVRPIDGLFEQAHHANLSTAFFYGWEPLRDIGRPLSLTTAVFRCARRADDTDTWLTDRFLEVLESDRPDFTFLYLVETDEKGGHDYGWMSPEYLRCISTALDNIQRVLNAVDEEYTVIVTADHGGHDQTHGTEMPEDMTIPMFFVGTDFVPGQELQNVSILDLAPTIGEVLGLYPAREWEGHSVIQHQEGCV